MIVMNPFFTRAISRAVKLLPHFPTQALLTILFPPHGIDTRPSNSKINSVRHDVDGRSSTDRYTWYTVGVEHARHTFASCLLPHPRIPVPHLSEKGCNVVIFLSDNIFHFNEARIEP